MEAFLIISWCAVIFISYKVSVRLLEKSGKL
jgi:hypothetical protein